MTLTIATIPELAVKTLVFEAAARDASTSHSDPANHITAKNRKNKTTSKLIPRNFLDWKQLSR